MNAMSTIRQVFDADRHVTEPLTIWRHYLGAQHQQHLPYMAEIVTADDGGQPVERAPMLFVDGQSIMNISTTARRIILEAAKLRHAEILDSQSPAGHLRQMDQDGIRCAALFPTYASYLVSVDTMSAELSCEYARAYNDWLHDFCRHTPERLIGIGLLSRHDPQWMVKEAIRVAGFGWKTIVMRPNLVKGQSLGSPAYNTFWATCAELGLAVVIHEGTHVRLPAVGTDRYQSRFAMHACSHPMEQMMAFLSLLEGGVLERHPGLKFAFLEAGCGWLPYWLWRLDELEYKHLRAEVANNVRMLPSEYFKRQCYIGIEPTEPLLAEVVAHIGAEHILFGTDYPHVDHEQSILDAMMTGGGQLAAADHARIMYGNAMAFYQQPAGNTA
ncbi:MAG: hypothetical protein RIQ60_1945 [Pseudomonadota bacterium]|jgi:predicted TIM-barrel fold metal-dependent hydrolase